MKAVALMAIVCSACLSFQDPPKFDKEQCERASEMRRLIQDTDPAKYLKVSDAQKYAAEANRCERYLFALYANTVEIEKRNRCTLGCQSRLILAGMGFGVLVGAAAVGAAR